MEKKVVLKVQVNCDKCRVKAMKLMASAEGVDSIAVQGSDRDQFVVIGDGVNLVNLARRLRKTVGHTSILSVGEAKEEEGKKKEKNESKPEEPKIEYNYMQWYPPNCNPNSQLVVHDQSYGLGPSCSIL